MVGDLFDPAPELRGVFDVVLEHTCLSGLHPSLRARSRRGIDLTLKPGGLLIGVWFINPDLDPGEEGPPFPFPKPDLTALFADGYEIVDDYVPDVSLHACRPGADARAAASGVITSAANLPPSRNARSISCRHRHSFMARVSEAAKPTGKVSQADCRAIGDRTPPSGRPNRPAMFELTETLPLI